MADMESSSNAHKRPRLGFEKYSNSKVLSDVTIRYGNTGELGFEAHRLLLSTKSYYFEAAFTGGFAENSAREMTLRDDDPDALKAMLNFAYDSHMGPPDNALYGDATTIQYFLGLYCVGDKYDFPEFLARVVSWFGSCLHHWLNRPRGSIGTDAVALEEFRGFVTDIYDLVGTEHRPGHPLVKVLLGIVDDQGPTSIVNNVGRNHPLITMTSQRVAEFGRDVFLHLMAKTGFSEADEQGKAVTTALCIGVKIECPTCGDIWWRVALGGEEEEMTIYCQNCHDEM